MPALDERLLQRIDQLIEKGEAIIERNHDRASRSKRVTSEEIDKDNGAFVEWQWQTVNFLANFIGRDNLYTQGFGSQVRTKLDKSVQAGLGILRALREDFESGFLTDIRTLVSAELFDDFLEMAEHLHANGYKDPAASLTGAVLEDGMRRIAGKKGVRLKTREDLSSLNQKLANAEVYNRLTQRRLQPWITLRNHADHGEFDEYSAADVAEMIRYVRSFLEEYLR